MVEIKQFLKNKILPEFRQDSRLCGNDGVLRGSGFCKGFGLHALQNSKKKAVWPEKPHPNTHTSRGKERKIQRLNTQIRQYRRCRLCRSRQMNVIICSFTYPVLIQVKIPPIGANKGFAARPKISKGRLKTHFQTAFSLSSADYLRRPKRVISSR